MTYCCEHARKAYELIGRADNLVAQAPSYTILGFVSPLLCSLWVPNARSCLRQARQELDACNCSWEKENLGKQNRQLEAQKQDLERNNNELKAFIQNRPGEITHTTSGQRGSSYFRETWTWKK